MSTDKNLPAVVTMPVLDDKTFKKKRDEAIKRLVTGKTPFDCIKERPGRGGSVQKYVDIGYMTEQANLLTTFHWKHEVLREEEFKVKDKIVELGAFVRVTFYGNSEEYSHESWGQKDVMYMKDDPTRPVSFFDDKKAAISDGIKKCLSYFGIAADVYAGKEVEFYLDDEEALAEMIERDGQGTFMAVLKARGLRPSKAFEMLGVKKLSEITDFGAAIKKLEGGDKP
jgi:hypothetical protein